MANKHDILDLYFMNARCQLIDLAAFLDRVDRHEGEEDFRIAALRRALPVLLENRPDRAKAVLDSLSDMTTTPAPTAHTQAAAGAPPL